MSRHEYFPGANTPQGFYSYFSHILPLADTKRKIILKGGPGTGKSSLMKKIAGVLQQNGIDTDLLHCSSDPSSLDAIVAPQIGFCMLDGTAPHIIDPELPGAVDLIINLGVYWEEKKIQRHKAEIIDLRSKIGDSFSAAYDFLRAASQVQKVMQRAEEKCLDFPKLYYACNRLAEELQLHKRNTNPGKTQKAFLSGFTPMGNINYIDSYVKTAEQVIQLDAPCGIAAKITTDLAAMIRQNAINAMLFYCPMQPDSKVEHIYLPEKRTFITTANIGTATKYIDLSSCLRSAPALHTEHEIFQSLLARSIEHIKNAKALHDALEKLYIPYMHFDAMQDLSNQIISDIL